MPSKTGSQHRLMAMASTPAGRARLETTGKTPPPASVAKEFLNADKGRKFAGARRKK